MGAARIPRARFAGIACAIDALYLHAAAPGPVSRIGGPALLPGGTRWPLRGPAPLSFLAAIDLAELPPQGSLPGAGVLLFFGDLEALGEAELHENRPHASIRVLAASAAEIVPAAAPAPIAPHLVLPATAVTFGQGPPVAAERDFGEIEFHDMFAVGTAGPAAVPAQPAPRHRVLGDGEEPGEVVLLELDLGERLLGFTVDSRAALAGEWDRVVARVSDR